ncbi:TetR/AcrR family transcriptional regulator [Cryptosporangium phraense]|uniref:TetR/AcrR family transcriptional regulator n=1 Tax=Cryptosporangium phraense TaxID=2593070 RepID=UPI0014791FAF|nr:TetR/AcrR family transcriptional regulator [Cryptosporangium phraense]
MKRPKNRKAQIALAAAELFCARGYHGVGVDEIAGVVGITGPAIYRHFPNKYAMLVHATRELGTSVRTAVDTALSASDDPERQVDGVLDALAVLSLEQRRVTGLYQWENRYLSAEHRAEFRHGLAALIDRVSDRVRAVRPELDRAQARLLTRAAFSAIASLSTHRAPAARARATDLLRRAGWALLRADVPDLTRSESAPVSALGPGRSRRAAEDAESRRETVLATAIRLFHQNGYHAVGMEDIGRAAGLRASSLYRYFPGKSDLLAAAYHRAADQVATSTASSLSDAAGDGEDALRRLVNGFVALTFEHRDLVAVYLAENNNLPDRDRHELRRIQREQVEQWVRLLEGVRPGLSTPDARLLVHAAHNVVTDLGGATDPAAPEEFRPVVTTLALSVLHRP